MVSNPLDRNKNVGLVSNTVSRLSTSFESSKKKKITGKDSHEFFNNSTNAASFAFASI